MLVLGFDTSTPAVSVAVVEVSAELTVRSERSEISPNRHGERLAPLIASALSDAGRTPSDLGAIVVGLGPGPFTGLRVGIMTGAAMGDALGIPVYGECSLDALALWPAPVAPRCAAVTDARRRQVYYATYTGRERVDLDIATPDEVANRLRNNKVETVVGAGAAAHPDVFADFMVDIERPSPPAAGICVLAADKARTHASGDRLAPLYLRRPDAVPPGLPKPVTAP